ncbi:MAG: A/G-specific adenine glycosylase [Ferruginibacter sp.]
MNSSFKEIFFTKTLMQWHSIENARSMPWKEEKDPYKIWLSEIILQQTRVNQGLEYYKKFVEKYPTIGQLATAKEQEVFKIWEGLGYYSRCRNLIHTAKVISNEYKGVFPNNFEAVLKLKGIGIYTASAILSFAFNAPYAVVDGNVARVLSRYFLIDNEIDSPAGKKLLQQMADLLLDKSQPAKYNQAIIDFGAQVCTPRNPKCPACPLQLHCGAYQHNLVDELPVKKKKAQKRKRFFYFIMFQSKGKTLIRKRNQKDIWEDLYEFPSKEVAKLFATQKPVFKIPVEFVEETAVIKTHEIIKLRQVLTHQLIEAVFLHCEVEDLPRVAGFKEVLLGKIKTFAFPRIIQHFLSALQQPLPAIQGKKAPRRLRNK